MSRDPSSVKLTMKMIHAGFILLFKKIVYLHQIKICLFLLMYGKSSIYILDTCSLSECDFLVYVLLFTLLMVPIEGPSYKY